jgi:hypothetical protein
MANVIIVRQVTVKSIDTLHDVNVTCQVRHAKAENVICIAQTLSQLMDTGSGTNMRHSFIYPPNHLPSCQIRVKTSYLFTGFFARYAFDRAHQR